MSARNLTESTVTMIRDYIKDNISTALADMRLERGDKKVQTAPPKSYFIYEGAKGLTPPAVFILADSVDLLKSQGPNAIMANVKVNISAVIEDTKEDHLTIKAYRYQDALFEILDQAQILSIDGNIKLVVIVQNAIFSPIFTQDTDKKSDVNAFRKEVVLQCDVRHFEQP